MTQYTCYYVIAWREIFDAYTKSLLYDKPENVSS